MGVQHGNVPLAMKESTHIMRAPDDGQKRKADPVTLSSEMTLRHSPDSQGYLKRIDTLHKLASHHVIGLSGEILFPAQHSTAYAMLLNITLFWLGVGDTSVCKVFTVQI